MKFLFVNNACKDKILFNQQPVTVIILVLKMLSVMKILVNVFVIQMPMVENVMNVNLVTGTFQVVNLVNVMAMLQFVMLPLVNVSTVMITLMVFIAMSVEMGSMETHLLILKYHVRLVHVQTQKPLDIPLQIHAT